MKLKDGLLVWVSMEYATYGLIVRGMLVVDAPPIARWMIGKNYGDVVIWLRRKRATIILLD